MSPPHHTRIDASPPETLRQELSALADAMVDARPADRPSLRARVLHAAEAHRRWGRGTEEVGRLLRHMISDLSRDAASLDTLYYARQLVVVADRIAN